MIRASVSDAESFELDLKNGKFLINGETSSADIRKLKENTWHVIHNHKSFTVELISAVRDLKKYELLINNKPVSVQLTDRYDDLLHALGMDKISGNKVDDLKAPMPGLVVDIRVNEGQEIKKGETLIILEAMKMENALKAAADAVIKEVLVNKGEAVEKNQVLIRLK